VFLWNPNCCACYNEPPQLAEDPWQQEKESMTQRLRATYQRGAFVPDTPCDLPEGAEVEIILQGPTLLPPEVTEPEERMRILTEMVDRMQQNPIPAEAPPLTREFLHVRR
jgi:hypothetical protein